MLFFTFYEKEKERKREKHKVYHLFIKKLKKNT